MKQNIAVEQFLAGRRVLIARFVAHRHKEVQNKAKKVVGIVNLYEVQCADGKAPTVQMWCPRNVQTVEQAAAQSPCTFKDGQKVVVEFDLMEPNHFDAKNGVMIRAGSVLPFE
jgi:cytochrome c-type biogenesis protein CcmE